MSPKFQVEVTLAPQRDALDDSAYTELHISVTDNGYQWHSLNVPAEKWPAVELAVMQAIAAACKRGEPR